MAKSTTAETLFSAIAKNPDDTDAYLVYADAIGGPTGELIVLMHQLETATDDGQRAALGAALDAYFTKHKAKIYGADLAKHSGIAWDWHLGFLKTVRYVPDISDEVPALVKKIIALPAARLLEKVVVFEDMSTYVKPLAKIKKVEIATQYRSIADAAKAGADGRWLEIAVTSTDLPPALFKLKHLEFLEIGGQELVRIGPEIAELSKLRRFDIDWMSGLTEIADEVFGIESLQYMSMYDCGGLKDRYHMGRVNALLGGFARAKTPSRRRIFETALFLGNAARAKKLAKPGDLLAALDSNMAAVREQALVLLSADAKAVVLGEAPRFCVLGKPKHDKKTLAGKLEALGATVAAKLDDDVTHVVLGESPGGKQAAINDRAIVYDAQLAALFAGSPQRKSKAAKGAAAASKMSIDWIREKLRTRDEKQVAEAIAALQDGVDESFVIELAIVVQDVTLEKSRDGAKKLLALHAPKVAAALAKHLKSSLLLESMGETKRIDRITAFASDAEIDGLEFAQLLLARARIALGYILARGKPADIARALGALIVDGVLDLSTKELSLLPDGISALPIVELDLSNNHFTQLPPQILKIKTLKRLDLTGNRIWKLPDSLAPLSLEKLDYSFNRVRKFPKAVLAQTDLVELDISNSEDYVDNESRITGLPAEIGKLKKLKKLGYNFQIMTAGFPAEMFALPLEELSLFQADLPAEIPPEWKKLTKLKKLDVRYSTWESKKAALKKLLPKCTLE